MNADSRGRQREMHLHCIKRGNRAVVAPKWGKWRVDAEPPRGTRTSKRHGMYLLLRQRERKAR